MSTSLEARTPLLDHRIIEFAATLPFEHKVSGKESKRILKEIVHEYIPAELMRRPKRGFSVPLREWMQGPLKEMVFDHLSPGAVQRRGILNELTISSMLNQFHRDQFHYTDLIWKLFIFEQWAERWQISR